jgi:hypothetical protein
MRRVRLQCEVAGDYMSIAAAPIPAIQTLLSIIAHKGKPSELAVTVGPQYRE